MHRAIELDQQMIPNLCRLSGYFSSMGTSDVAELGVEVVRLRLPVNLNMQSLFNVFAILYPPLDSSYVTGSGKILKFYHMLD